MKSPPAKTIDSGLAPYRSAGLVPSAELSEQIRETKELIEASRALRTRDGYKNDWVQFLKWCNRQSVDWRKVTPEVLMLYLNEMAKARKLATIRRHVAAISSAYQAAQLEDPAYNSKIRTLMKGITRTLGSKQTQKAPVTTARLDQMLAVEPNDQRLIRLRDRAVLLVGFSGAFRRTELVSLQMDDIEFVEQGMKVTIRKSKTDQEGIGRVLAVPYDGSETCAVTALKDWTDASGITEGPIFRRVTKGGVVGTDALTAQVVATIVKKYAALIGLDADKFGGHSLRSGLVTSAAEHGASIGKIQEITGHKTTTMVGRYIREADLFKNNAVTAAKGTKK